MSKEFFANGYWWPEYAKSKDVNYSVDKSKDMVKAVSLCKNKRVCIQSGGNLGIWPAQLSKYFQQVYTFEPEAESFRILKLNTDSCSNVISGNIALGCHEKMVTIESKGIGSHRISDKGCVVNMMTIDQMEIEDVDAIFLDVEGYESHVLIGAKKTIQTYSPIIQIEDTSLRDRYKDLPVASAILKALGYRQVGSSGKDTIWSR